ncbi:S8 family peptidase [Singulisphaera sp. PoT]|uniref:S8 family peptidase n=1 Tax=Singulisphaera sp. PoT TaxID=3411797 RepID=UPI003BF4C3B7
MDGPQRAMFDDLAQSSDRKGVFDLITNSARRQFTRLREVVEAELGGPQNRELKTVAFDNVHSASIRTDVRSMNTLLRNESLIKLISRVDFNRRVSIPVKQSKATKKKKSSRGNLGFTLAAGYALGAGSNDWWLRDTSLDVLHGHSFRGRGRKIAVVDSGVDAGMSTVRNKILAFSHFDQQGGILVDDVNRITDAGCHGSKVCDLIAAGAPDAQFIVTRVLDGIPKKEVGTVEQITGGLQWIVDKHVELQREGNKDGIDIANISIDVVNKQNVIAPMIHILNALGIQPVVAVGNRGKLYRSRIADLGMSVGAIDDNGSVWHRSCRRPHIVAPGVGIWCNHPPLRELKYKVAGSYNGTSFSTAITTACLAVLMEAIDCDHHEYANALIDAARQVSGRNGRHRRSGWGRLNVMDAYNLLRAKHPSP